MTQNYKLTLRKNKKINFSYKLFPYLFILKKKPFSQNLQKYYKHQFLLQNFQLFTIKQKKFLNFLKTTEYKQTLRVLHGTLIIGFFPNTTFSETIQQYFILTEKYKDFNKHFSFCLLFNFQEHLIISKTLLNYYFSFEKIKLFNLKPNLSLILYYPIINLNNYLFFYAQLLCNKIKN